MKGIQIQSLFEEFRTETQHVVQIDGGWYKVTCIETPILDGRHACSSNIYKWDMLGKSYCFKIEPCEQPEQELPKQVEEFLGRFKENGKDSAILNVPREDNHFQLDLYPGHTWGWNEKIDVTEKG